MFFVKVKHVILAHTFGQQVRGDTTLDAAVIAQFDVIFLPDVTCNRGECVVEQPLRRLLTSDVEELPLPATHVTFHKTTARGTSSDVTCRGRRFVELGA